MFLFINNIKKAPRGAFCFMLLSTCPFHDMESEQLGELAVLVQVFEIFVLTWYFP